MFVDMVVVGMVQMSIMEIIDMITMPDGHMTAPRAVLVAVSFVDLAVWLSHPASLTP